MLRVSFEKSGRDKEMVLFHLNGFYPPLVFAADETNLHVVCEFLDGSFGKDLEKTIHPKGRFIQRIRLSSQEDPKKVRAILDLAEKYQYDLKQVFLKKTISLW